jgi:hypothetical protein
LVLKLISLVLPSCITARLWTTDEVNNWLSKLMGVTYNIHNLRWSTKVWFANFKLSCKIFDWLQMFKLTKHYLLLIKQFCTLTWALALNTSLLIELQNSQPKSSSLELKNIFVNNLCLIWTINSCNVCIF